MRTALPSILLLLILAASCKKDSASAGMGRLQYNDSIFYLRTTDYTVLPLGKRTGTYTAFPGNLDIDNSTGAVTITVKGKDGESQTGLRYKIRFTSVTETDSTYITLGGLQYFDQFYYLSHNDSIIAPFYNGSATATTPAGNYAVNADNKLAINPQNGQINIAETIRRGFFDNPLHGSWKQTTIKYTYADNGAVNAMDVILYYYNTLNDVPSNVSALMQAHQRLLAPTMAAPSIPGTTGAIDNNLSSDLSPSKPRPPCIIIIGH